MDAARAIREADSKCEYGMITVGEYERIIAPFRDVEPVVRCKDCDNRECDGRAGTIVCGITGFSHSRLWFCADGKRKE